MACVNFLYSSSGPFLGLPTPPPPKIKMLLGFSMGLRYMVILPRVYFMSQTSMPKIRFIIYIQRMYNSLVHGAKSPPVLNIVTIDMATSNGTFR